MKRFLPLIVLAVLAGVYVGYKRYLAAQPFEWAGTVEARTVTVGSRTGGRIKKINVQEGDHVTAGQALIELEPGDLTAQRAMAEAQLEQAQAAFDKLKKGARPEEIAQANARAAQAGAALAETRHGSRAEQVAAGAARVAQAQGARRQGRARCGSRAPAARRRGAIAKAEADANDTALVDRARRARCAAEGARRAARRCTRRREGAGRGARARSRCGGEARPGRCARRGSRGRASAGRGCEGARRAARRDDRRAR